MKQEKGFTLIIVLSLLIIISLSFIVINNNVYSSIKNTTKNQIIENIQGFQQGFIATLENNKWVENGQHGNEAICNVFDCIKNTTNELVVSPIECDTNIYSECFSVTLQTDYDNLNIASQRNIYHKKTNNNQ